MTRGDALVALATEWVFDEGVLVVEVVDMLVVEVVDMFVVEAVDMLVTSVAPTLATSRVRSKRAKKYPGRDSCTLRAA